MITIQMQDEEGLEEVADKLDDSSHSDFDVNRKDNTITLWNLDREDEIDIVVGEEIEFHNGIVI